MSNGRWERLQGGGDEFVRNPSALEDDAARVANGLGELGRPYVFPDQERA